jgi:hypothetical protein
VVLALMGAWSEPSSDDAIVSAASTPESLAAVARGSLLAKYVMREGALFQEQGETPSEVRA